MIRLTACVTYLGLALSPYLPLVLAQSWPDLTVWQEGRSRRESSNVYLPKDIRNPLNNDDCVIEIGPGKTHVLADLKGPGIITHIWITFLQLEGYEGVPGNSASPQDMLLRIFWDGRERPEVEAPLGDFFASGFGRQMPVISVPVVVEDADSYNCYWRMPFRKSARIEIINQSKDKNINWFYYNVDWIEKKTVPDNTMYFCAKYRQEYPQVAGRDYIVLDADGPGHYVGAVLSVRTRSPQWFGEGDELVYIDGEESPSIRGTGTEDYFLSAFGLKECSTPYFGVPYLNTQVRIVGQRTCSYRWHLYDPIVFEKSIKVAFEHYGWMTKDENPKYEQLNWNEREDDFASVAFWYQMGPAKDFAPSTTAEQRRLPNIERVVVWGKDLQGQACHSPGETKLQKGPEYRESGNQLVFSPSDESGAWIEGQFEIKEKEPLRLLLVMTKSPDGGIWQPSLNGIKLGKPIDLYAAKVEVPEFHLMDFWPDPGRYALRLECTGKNANSSGRHLGLDSIRLRERRPRVKEYGHEKNWNWKEKQVLNNY
ncbi:MAG TPA: DUF2961 domain-containing protein [Phycisphaerae bacterium]|nr:DUF2961 domain-containing protein [Phycisphaerae bacterium]HRY67233.1 DUF2961 domain-containing protein [Phycisphaerae bacterium]HSA26397.1 DUF2961 domain-containing protein [Phycisphaerae bacterium]